MNLPSKVLEEAVQAFAQLPGIGQKSALRLVLHLLKNNPRYSERLGESLLKLHRELQYCTRCHNISSAALCDICADPRRDQQLICVVEDVRDVIALENTAQYKGLYHVLGGLISPMDGVGPAQLTIDSLVNKLQAGGVHEIIVALSTTMEGDTTLFYIYKKIKPFSVTVSTLARGMAIGGDLEYTDEVTLGKSILNRVPYENQLIR